jgi:hypothetical protein
VEWFPIGPDYVAELRVADFRRLSTRNAWGWMGRIRQVAFEPSSIDGAEPETIYAVLHDFASNVGVARRRAGEKTWTCITDGLRAADNNFDPHCVAVNPHYPNVVYVGTVADEGLYVSLDRGETWQPKLATSGGITRLVVDPRPPGRVDQTIVYGGREVIFSSRDNGRTWLTTLATNGRVDSFTVLMDEDGELHSYAAVAHAGTRTGVWFARGDPNVASSWALLSGRGGLPAFVPGTDTTPPSFGRILLDACRARPNCAYAWIAGQSTPFGIDTVTHGLYQTVDAGQTWTLQAAPPTADGRRLDPYNGSDRTHCFAVAPNSPGDGSTPGVAENDVLFFGGAWAYRSVDSGRTWSGPVLGNHMDFLSFAFYPEHPESGRIPRVYECNDGGLSYSPRLADPNLDVAGMFAEGLFNAGETVTPDSPRMADESRGLTNSLAMGITEDVRTPPYIGSWDNGIAVRRGGGVWASVAPAFDGTYVAAAPGPQGMAVWFPVPGRRVATLIDHGPWTDPQSLGAVDDVLPVSNLMLDAQGRCLAGVSFAEDVTETTAQTGTGPDQTISVQSTMGIRDGLSVRVGTITGRASAVNSSRSTFRFSGSIPSLPPRTPVAVWRPRVVRIAPDGAREAVGAHFAPEAIRSQSVSLIAAHRATEITQIACLVWAPDDAGGERLYRLDAGATGPVTQAWQDVTNGRPDDMWVTGLLVTRGGETFVMNRRSIAVTVGQDSFFTPLFRVTRAGTWIPQRCASLATGTFPDGTAHPFGPMAEDPSRDDVLYAAQAGRVFRLRRTAIDLWTWEALSDGLPGALVTQLVAGNLRPRDSIPFSILRAATDGRGVWETVLPGSSDAAGSLYLRRTPFDQGWLKTIADGEPNPYVPGAGVWHWDSPAIKVEAPQEAGGRTFYQSDPEGSGVVFSDGSSPTLSLSPVEFGLIREPSGLLPSGARVRVHVEVNNRSRTPDERVCVWVLWTECGTALPRLDETDVVGVRDAFWARFGPDGTIAAPPLPEMRWQQIADPQFVEQVDVDDPRIASFVWETPTVLPGEAGHYCLAAFVHSVSHPIRETTRNSIDLISTDNRQVAQRNVHVAPVTTMATALRAAGTPPDGPSFTVWFSSGEARNPSRIVWDLRHLPDGASLWLQLAGVPIRGGRPRAVTGARTSHVSSWWARARYLRDVWSWHLRRRRGHKPARPPFYPVWFGADAGGQVALDDLELRSGRRAGARMVLALPDGTQPSRDNALWVIQYDGDRVLGGSTFHLPVSPDRGTVESELKRGAALIEAERLAESGAELVWPHVEIWNRAMERAGRGAMPPEPEAGASI